MLKLSVVLATFNEEANLARCLDSVRKLAEEIIVVDGTSKDKTVEIAKTFGAKVTVTSNPPTVIPSTVTTTLGGDGIQKILSNNGKDGLEMVYVDVSNNLPDTVRAFIPSEKTTKPEVKKYGDRRKKYYADSWTLCS